MSPRQLAQAAHARLCSLITASRPVHPDTAAALGRRWNELPEAARTPAQLLGRRTAGCEGTHGVFPRCNLACTPCYHAKEAQQVRVDGPHTLAEVDRQMAYLRSVRGDGQHAQLIGGEVTLLGPEAHAGALQVMQSHGRKPMSMTTATSTTTTCARWRSAPTAAPDSVCCASPATSTRCCSAAAASRARAGRPTCTSTAAAS